MSSGSDSGVPCYGEDGALLGSLAEQQAREVLKTGGARLFGSARKGTLRLIFVDQAAATDALAHTDPESSSRSPFASALQSHYTTHLQSGLKCYAQKRVVGGDSGIEQLKRWKEDKPFSAHGKRPRVPPVHPVATVPDLLPARIDSTF